MRARIGCAALERGLTMKRKTKSSPSISPVPHSAGRGPGRVSRLFGSRKLRCGGAAFMMTALVVALVVCVNYLAMTLENTYALSIDCSYNAISTQSETTKSVLDGLNKDVHLYYLHTTSGETSDSSLLADDTLISILRRYAAQSAHITYSEEDIVKNPTFKDRFKDMLGENAISANCLIVYCAKNDRARVLSANDFITLSYSLDSGNYSQSGYTYEKSITEAILYVTQDELPTLQILTGHGELSETDTSVLNDTLVSNNYQVERVTLGTEEGLNAEAPLLILCPQFDLTEKELAELLDFAARGGDFFVISQYSDPVNLTNFNALMLAYGIVPLDGLCVADSSDTQSYYSDSPAILIPYMQSTDTTQTLVSSGKDILLLTGSRAFDISAELSTDLNAEVILKSGQAYLRTYQDGAEGISKQAGDREGVFNLALLSTWTQTDGTRSRMFIAGNSSIFTDSWLFSNTYATEFLLQILKTLQGKQPISLDIVQKTAVRGSLSLGSLMVPALIALLLPMLALIAALIVLLPRKNL